MGVIESLMPDGPVLVFDGCHGTSADGFRRCFGALLEGLQIIGFVYPRDAGKAVPAFLARLYVIETTIWAADRAGGVRPGGLGLCINNGLRNWREGWTRIQHVPDQRMWAELDRAPRSCHLGLASMPMKACSGQAEG